MLEKAGQTEEASQIFESCFKNIDGRIGDTNSDKKSVKSQISKAISIRTRGNSVVTYGQNKQR